LFLRNVQYLRYIWTEAAVTNCDALTEEYILFCTKTKCCYLPAWNRTHIVTLTFGQRNRRPFGFRDPKLHCRFKKWYGNL